MTFRLVVTIDDEDVELNWAAGDLLLHSATRHAVTITGGDPGIIIPPGIVITPSSPAVTPVVRQGNVASVLLSVGPVVSSVNPTGTLTFSVEGHPALARR